MDKALELAIDPPLATADLRGIGGALRRTPEDFFVEEIPAYDAGGEGTHLFVTLQKRGLNTDDAIREVARQLGVNARDIGVAGKKDKIALTRQRISIPDLDPAAIADFDHPAIELRDPQSHDHKLRRGHLRGNRFAIVVRELPEPDLARERIAAKLERLDAVGVPNYFGVQRFGRGGANALRGLAGLRKGLKPRRGDFHASAAQSALFNLWLARRREAEALHRVWDGDVLAKAETGGLFVCEDPDTDQPRFDAGEVRLTGPMFGSKMRSGPEESSAARFEAGILEELGIAMSKLRRLGKSLPGTRRVATLSLRDLRVDVEDAPPDGICSRFTLPAGSYATVLLREWMRPEAL